jgi:hypothetical protein
MYILCCPLAKVGKARQMMPFGVFGRGREVRGWVRKAELCLTLSTRSRRKNISSFPFPNTQTITHHHLKTLNTYLSPYCTQYAYQPSRHPVGLANDRPRLLQGCPQARQSVSYPRAVRTRSHRQGSVCRLEPRGIHGMDWFRLEEEMEK